MTNIEQSRREESMESKIKRTAKKRASYTRKFLSKHYTKKEFFSILNQFKIKDVDFDNDQSLALAVHDLQKQVGLPLNTTFRGCDGKFGKITMNAASKKMTESKSLSARSTISDDINLPKSKENQTTPETNHTLSEYLIKKSEEIWNKPKKYSSIMRYAKKGKCEHFCGALSRYLYKKFTGEKKRFYVWGTKIAKTSTRTLRGKAIKNFKKNDFKVCTPGEVFFVNRASKHKGGNAVIPGTTNKIRKIADKRHWFVFLGYDENNEPRFADNWGPSHSLASLKRKYKHHNRVVLNVHDPHRESRQYIAASISNELERTLTA